MLWLVKVGIDRSIGNSILYIMQLFVYKKPDLCSLFKQAYLTVSILLYL